MKKEVVVAAVLVMGLIGGAVWGKPIETVQRIEPAQRAITPAVAPVPPVVTSVAPSMVSCRLLEGCTAIKNLSKDISGKITTVWSEAIVPTITAVTTGPDVTRITIPEGSNLLYDVESVVRRGISPCPNGSSLIAKQVYLVQDNVGYAFDHPTFHDPSAMSVSSYPSSGGSARDIDVNRYSDVQPRHGDTLRAAYICISAKGNDQVRIDDSKIVKVQTEH